MAEEHYSPERLAQFAKRARGNHNAVLAFTGLMAGVALIFIFFHLIRLVSSRTTSTSQKSKKPSPLVKLGRHIRSITLRKAPALPSVGHAGVVGIYFAINVALTFGFIDYNNMTPLSNIGSRAGWMAIANMVLLVFLALKNTPLAFLSSYSYERLNSLHQYAGYSTILFTIIHVSLYCTYFVQAGRPTRLLYTNEIFGMVAALSFLALGITGGIVRRFNYELFYVLHVSFWVLAVVMVGLHQPELSKKIIFGTCVAGGMWGLDRLIRFVRLMAYSTNNTVIVTPLPHGATRVTLKKPPVGAVAGKHCFLWIPRIRAVETHPFTMFSTEPTEFVINSYDGFTSDLHQYAAKHPGAELKASVEGPYGTFPSPASRDKLVLVAGGSGATFTFGTALHMLKSMSPDDNKSITFVWVVRDRSYLNWFTQSLKTLNSDRRVSILIYVTRSSTVEQLTPPSSSAGRGDDEETKLSELGIEPRQTLERAPDSSTSIDFEKTAPSPSSTSDDSDAPASVRETALELALPIIDGRPDVGSLVRTEIEAMPSHGSVLVMGCGPAGLMTDLRNTTAGCIRAEGPTVELHCEQFGW